MVKGKITLSMNKTYKISEIRGKFHNEWLLITVDEVDASGAPSKGKLIAHSKSAEELWEEAEKHREPVMVIFSEDWPEDVFAFHSSSGIDWNKHA
ncbi:MAG: hypothetical protein ABIE74_05635 [Pseudomonadota bacterium]